MLNFLAAAIGSTWELPFEIPYIVWLQSLGHEGGFLYYLMNILSAFGEEIALIGIMGLIYWGFDKKRGAKIGMMMLTATLLTPMVKNVAKRTRPFDSHPNEVANWRNVDGYSFPSGHSSGSASVFLGTAVTYKDRKYKWMWIISSIIPVLVAFSRNVVGAHYPTDVVAGLALGVGVVFLMDWLSRVVKNQYYLYGGLLIVGFAGIFYCKTDDFFTAYGLAIGFMCGIIFEEKLVNFQNTRVWWRIILRVVVGGAIYLGLNEGLKAVVGACGHKICLDCGTVASQCLDSASHTATAWYHHPDYFWFDMLFRTLRYAIIAFLLLGVYPMLFAQTEKLWKKWGWLKEKKADEQPAAEQGAESPEEAADVALNNIDESAENTATIAQEGAE